MSCRGGRTANRLGPREPRASRRPRGTGRERAADEARPAGEQYGPVSLAEAGHVISHPTGEDEGERARHLPTTRPSRAWGTGTSCSAERRSPPVRERGAPRTLAGHTP